AWSSNGATSLENVTANGNGAWGAFVVGTNGVTLTGTNQFNGQYQGLAVSNSGDVTLNNITANSNITGVKVESSGNVTLNNVDASLNQVGVAVSNSGNVFLTDENISNNAEIGLYVKCVASLNFSVNPPNIINNPIDILIDPTCPVPVVYPLTIVAQSQGKFFALDCEHADGYSVILPNGDLVQIFCDVSGRASISRLDNTALPSSLPEGYTYASAFQADIVQGGRSISVIPETESGYIKASFVGSSLQQGSAYSILYWDDGQWVPLKDFMLAENGNPLVFDLNPGVSDDTRKILSGVKLVTVRGEPRVEVSTNFPGIFVLAQR
ncbi:MAG TPA: right-handed parallel beta-helix repeat-containing protein, partial [Anaerolineales bacterium]|nr:right-handed parallel beta-helix repeat-containing protein [Anaerolineales bacterium]